MVTKKKKVTPRSPPTKKKKQVPPRPPSSKKKKAPARVRVTETKRSVEPLPPDPRPDIPAVVRHPHKIGQPAKPFIREKYVPWAQALARRGLTEPQIATAMRIGKSKLYEWQATYPDFAEALEAGRDHAAAMVENAIFERALGFEVEESHIVGRPEVGPDKKPVLDPDTGKPKIVPEKVERIKKRVVGDVSAQQFILRNLAPERWKDAKEITGKDGQPLVPKATIMAILGTDEFRKADAAVRAKLAADAAALEQNPKGGKK